MCTQCAAAAMSAGVAATGARWWVVAALRGRVSDRVVRSLTVALLTAGVLAAGVAFG